MSGKICTIAPRAIVSDGMQIRVSVSREHIDDIAELFDENTPTWPDGLPPVVVFFDGKRYYLADGHHRLAAAIQAGCQEIRVDIRKGTREEAIRFACGANSAHGLRRTNGDKRNSVRAAYALDPDNSCRAIARLCKVSHTLAENVIREIKSEESKIEENKETSQVGIGNIANSDNCCSKLKESCGGGGLTGKVEDGRSSGESETAAPICSQQSLSLPAIPLFDEAESLIRKLADVIDRLAGLPGAELIRSRYLKLRVGKTKGESVERIYSADLENLLRELRHWRPHGSRCPACGEAPSQSCNLCLGLPYVAKAAYERMTDDQRKRLEAGSTADAA